MAIISVNIRRIDVEWWAMAAVRMREEKIFINIETEMCRVKILATSWDVDEVKWLSYRMPYLIISRVSREDLQTEWVFKINKFYHENLKNIFQSSNLLSAVLCLVKELDCASLEVVEHAVRCRIDELTESMWNNEKILEESPW
jgi:hypothetical protein